MLLLLASAASAFQLGGTHLHEGRFGVMHLHHRGRPTRAGGVLSMIESAAVAVAEDCGCDAPTGGVMVAGKAVTAQGLRDMSLADASGKRVRAGDLIGEDGKAVVLFLRHLG